MSDESATSLVFGREVRRYRELRGMTQAELAEKVERSASMLAAIEQGRRQVHADEIVPFARALDVLPVALLGPVFGGGYKEGYIDGVRTNYGDLRRFVEEQIDKLDERLEGFLSDKCPDCGNPCRPGYCEDCMFGGGEAHE